MVQKTFVNSSVLYLFYRIYIFVYSYILIYYSKTISNKTYLLLTLSKKVISRRSQRSYLIGVIHRATSLIVKIAR